MHIRLYNILWIKWNAEFRKLFWRMDLKRLVFKLVLMLAVLMTGRGVFCGGLPAKAEESVGPRPDFRRVLILFPAEAGPRVRDEFMAGLKEVRERHEEERLEFMRKWRESAPERERKKQEREEELVRTWGENGAGLEDADTLSMLSGEPEMSYAGPSFLYDAEVIPVRLNGPWRTGEEGPLADDFNKVTSAGNHFGAVIVVASDEIASQVAGMFKSENREHFPIVGDSRDGRIAVVFAGVSSFDESLRRESIARRTGAVPREYGNYAIVHPADPWPNADLALRLFPNTKKVVLLASGKNWDAGQETALRSKLGPGKTLKTVLLPDGEKTEDGLEVFRAEVEAECQADTVIVSLSSVEWGLDPVEWLPDDFDACPVFADTPPTRKNAVGGFCRSMNKLAVQVGDLLEELSKDPLEVSGKNIPTTIVENDELWINEAAMKRYRLKTSDFPEKTILTNTKTKKAPVVKVYRTWTKKRILLLLAANAAVLFGLALFTLSAVRAIRRRRRLSEAVYDSLPVRVFVMDRDGRFLEYHKQYGEVEQVGEFPWKNINDVPWLRNIGAGMAVCEAFDSGKTVVREFVIDGERRVVVLSSTPSDVFGKPAVIAVSSDFPEQKPQA